MTKDHQIILGKIGSLHVRLAATEAEIRAAQRLRYRVFVDELGAQLKADRNQDEDHYDAYCDHLIVIDTSIPAPDVDRIVGTYRLMGAEQAEKAGGYYSEQEFKLRSMLDKHPTRRFLELGRSCVLPPYRTKRTIELLWQGIWAYAQAGSFDVMMGCASFPGTVPARHAQALGFLYHHARATCSWQIKPKPEIYSSMDLMPSEAINAKTAFLSLPPLVKGYVRVGALFGSGAVIDQTFNTTDVMVVLPVERIAPRYKTYYGPQAERFAA